MGGGRRVNHRFADILANIRFVSAFSYIVLITICHDSSSPFNSRVIVTEADECFCSLCKFVRYCMSTHVFDLICLYIIQQMIPPAGGGRVPVPSLHPCRVRRDHLLPSPRPRVPLPPRGRGNEADQALPSQADQSIHDRFIDR